MSQELYELLNSHADKEQARQVALKFLDDTKVYQDGPLESIRILDVQTLRWMPEFTTKSGTKYYVVSPEDGLSLRRYTNVRKAIMIATTGFTATDYSENITKAIELVNAIGTPQQKVAELSVLLYNMQQTAAKAAEEWDKVAWAATHYILREGEDPTTYDEGTARAKMEDWNESGLDCMNLFFCSLLWEKRHNGVSNEFIAKLLAV